MFEAPPPPLTWHKSGEVNLWCIDKVCSSSLSRISDPKSAVWIDWVWICNHLSAHTCTLRLCVCVCSSTICFTCDVLQISTELLEAPRAELQRDRGRRGRSLSPNLVVTTICCRHPHPDTRSQSGKRRREEMSRGKMGKPVNLGRRGAKKATVIVVCAVRKSMAQKKLICFDLFLEYICTYSVYVCVLRDSYLVFQSVCDPYPLSRWFRTCLLLWCLSSSMQSFLAISPSPLPLALTLSISLFLSRSHPYFIVPFDSFNKWEFATVNGSKLKRSRRP